jgi:hypothetical protein
LSQQAYEEFNELEIICQNNTEKILLGQKDNWSYIWGNSDYSSHKAYKALIGSQPAIPHFFGFGGHLVNQNINSSSSCFSLTC